MSPGSIGLIADTHGLMRPWALESLAGCSTIIHAGDVGKPEVLAALREIAPVVAVRGNNDRGTWADALPLQASVSHGDIRLLVLHDLSTLDLDPCAHGYRIVVAGHSHKPAIIEKGGVLYVNPGSAGPRRFKLPISVAWIDSTSAGIAARILHVDADGRTAILPPR